MKVEGALVYEGYPESGVGNSVVLDGLLGVTDADKRLSTNKMKINGEDIINKDGQTVFVSFIAQIDGTVSKTSARDFFTFEGYTGSNFSRGRVFVENQGDGTMFIGVSKNASSQSDIGWIMDPAVPTDTMLFYTDSPILFVVAYEGHADYEDELGASVEGDVVKVYVYPEKDVALEDQTYQATALDINSGYGDSNPIGINLRQRGVQAQISGIRVGFDWDEVVWGGTTSSIELNAADAADASIYAVGNTVYTSENGSVEIYSVTGNRVFAGYSNGSVSTALQSGLYIVKFTAENGVVSSEKVIIE